MAENIKKNLSNVQKMTIKINNWKYTITRNEFENLINEFLNKCITLIHQVISDANITNNDIAQIVLVGGTTRIPLIQQKLKLLFNNNIPINKSINPDEAVAYGAAIQASILMNVGSKTKDLLLLDVTPLSLGIETSGGIMNIIIQRNSTLPIEASKIFSTVDDNQDSVNIKVYQGERQFTKDNILITTFTLEGLPRVPRGVPKIKVTFKLDCDGLLQVSAIDKNTGLINTITMNSESNLSSEEINKLITEAEQFKSHDIIKKRTLEEINNFEKYIYDIQRIINNNNLGDIIDINLINQYLLNTLDWIIMNKDEELEVIQNSRTTVEFNLKPHLDKIYSHMEQLKISGININNNTNDNIELDELLNNMLSR